MGTRLGGERDWLKEAKKALRDAADGTAQKTPDLLYHYTSGAGLSGILGRGAGPQTSRLRAYSIRQMSDSSELEYGVTLVKEAMDSAAQKGGDRRRFVTRIAAMLAELDRELITSTDPKLHFFVACFSAKENDLSQWRAYKGQSSGLAIGYRTSELEKPGLRFRQVEYDETAQRKRVDALIEAAMIRLPTAPTDRTRDELHRETANQVLGLACLFKNAAYKVEDEWRLVIWRVTGKNDNDVQVDECGAQLRMYLELDIFTASSIEEVWIGPGGNEQSDAVYRLLRGFPRGRVRFSDIPER